jgi:hypothetical protein
MHHKVLGLLMPTFRILVFQDVLLVGSFEASSQTATMGKPQILQLWLF